MTRTWLVVAATMVGTMVMVDPATAAALAASRVDQVPTDRQYSSRKLVALTFDDGPSPTYTPQILSILARKNARATFFQVGREADRSQALVRRIARAGHTLGGHTWNHRDMTKMSEPVFRSEVDRANALLGRLGGRPVRCVRPPFGAFNDQVLRRVDQRGLTTTMWGVDTRDWTRPGTETIVRRALDGLKPGAILLLHDGGGNRDQTVKALPRIIDGIRARGYTIVSIC